MYVRSRYLVLFIASAFVSSFNSFNPSLSSFVSRSYFSSIRLFTFFLFKFEFIFS
ncbi:hypothetical protein ChPV227 [Cheloniid poxvirus 1]|nr:hypothetical protein ChPV227 [Cheloniid poxvirus 1]